eukprot:SM000057S18375  [mRNA]  locus=s57:281939:285591:- [translate_table: standard]
MDLTPPGRGTVPVAGSAGRQDDEPQAYPVGSEVDQRLGEDPDDGRPRLQEVRGRRGTSDAFPTLRSVSRARWGQNVHLEEAAANDASSGGGRGEHAKLKGVSLSPKVAAASGARRRGNVKRQRRPASRRSKRKKRPKEVRELELAPPLHLQVTDVALQQAVVEEVRDPEDRSLHPQCDLYHGRWVPDSTRPLYSGLECRHISVQWSCRKTSRPDFEYEQYSWQPHACELPRFDPHDFLQRMRGKKMAYVGDSLGQQHFQSMLCLITAGKDDLEMEDVGPSYGFHFPPGAKRPTGWAFRFTAYDMTLMFSWSATLCKLQPVNASDSSSLSEMHLDRPDSFLKKFVPELDILVLNTGHHWHRQKIKQNNWEMRLHGEPLKVVRRKPMMIWQAHELAVTNVARWIDGHLDPARRPLMFFRTLSPRHFIGGDWNTGGRCDQQKESLGEEELAKRPTADPIAEAAVNGTGLLLLNITHLSQYRVEAHPSVYDHRFPDGAPTGIQDCLHWCLPGVPDTWNEIIYAKVILQDTRPQAASER